MGGSSEKSGAASQANSMYTGAINDLNGENLLKKNYFGDGYKEDYTMAGVNDLLNNQLKYGQDTLSGSLVKQNASDARDAGSVAAATGAKGSFLNNAISAKKNANSSSYFNSLMSLLNNNNSLKLNAMKDVSDVNYRDTGARQNADSTINSTTLSKYSTLGSLIGGKSANAANLSDATGLGNVLSIGKTLLGGASSVLGIPGVSDAVGLTKGYWDKH